MKVKNKHVWLAALVVAMIVASILITHDMGVMV